MRGLRWRAAAPDRWGWVRLFASPSSYLLLIALVLTAAAKLRVLREIESIGAWPLWWLACIAADTALYGGLAALFALGERRGHWLMAATTLLSVLIAAVAIINSAYLGITGEQLTWQALALGFDRFGDVSGIVGQEVSRLEWRAGIGGLLLFGAPVLALLALRRTGRSLHPSSGAASRAHAAGLCAGLALCIAVLAPGGSAFALERLGGNAVLQTYWGWLTADTNAREAESWFDGYDPTELVEPGAIRALAAGARPNVVLLVLESTRRDITSLATGTPLAQTPNLVGLARRGLEMTRARAVLPHTTKSLFSMLCGRLPLLQLALYESSTTTDIQCVPDILRAAGWRTAFFQSSVGVFEDRPRLVHNLGFATFAAWEDIGGETLGYLASDDASLAVALAGWLDQAPSGSSAQPFFATLLTSATHHPYELPAAAAARATARRAAVGEPVDRYHRLVEEEDRLVGRVLELLTERGLAERTIVIAIGDHGEGFGDKGIRQHDNNFYEEGLHVPWVMAGPGVRQARVNDDVSVIDLTPTLLDILGAPLSAEAMRATPGRSLARGEPGPRMLVFSCWYDARCRGFVSTGRKVIFIPEAERAFWFDLAADPMEREPRPLTYELRQLLDQAHGVVDAHRTPDWPSERGLMNDFPPWTCPADQPCRHPKSPPGGLFGAD